MELLIYVNRIEISIYSTRDATYVYKYERIQYNAIMKEHRMKPYMLILFAIALWGSSFAFVKIGIGYCSEFLFVSIRFLIASIIALFLFRRKIMGIGKSEIKWGSIIGITLFGGFIFQTISLKYSKVANTAFISSLFIIIIPFLSHYIEKVKIKKSAIVSIFVAICGLYLLTGVKNLQFNIGDSLALLSAIAFAFEIVVIQIATKSNNSENISFIAFVTVFICSSIFIPFESYKFVFNIRLISVLIYLGFICTGLALWIQMRYQKHLNTVFVGLFYLLEPIFALLFGWIIFREILTLKGMLGAGLILFSGLISECPFKRDVTTNKEK